MLNKFPDIKKHAWSDLGRGRVWTTLAIFFLVYSITIVTSTNTRNSQPEDLVKALQYISKAFLFIFTFLCFTGASRSINSEVKNGTWDFQRMTSKSALQLTIGKLIGPHLLSLISYFINFAILALAYWMMFETNSSTSPFQILYSFLLLLFFSLTSGLFLSLKSSKENGYFSISKVSEVIIFILLLFVIFYLDKSSAIEYKSRGISLVNWYGGIFSRGSFYLATATALCFWSFWACLRQMKVELQYKLSPKFQISFLLFVLFFLYGFVFSSIPAEFINGGVKYFGVEGHYGHQILSDAKGFCFLEITNICTNSYFASFFLFSIPLFSVLLVASVLYSEISIVKVRKLSSNLRAKNYKNMLSSAPFSLIVAGFLFTLVILSLLSSPIDNFRPFVLTLKIFFLSLRDASIFLYFQLFLNTTRQRKDLACILWLVFAYGLIPFFLKPLLSLDLMILIFYPPFSDEKVLSVVICAVWAIVSVYFIRRKIKEAVV